MSEFKKALKGIDQAIKQATARALNRALSSARTKITRDIASETGLPNKVIKTRMLETKARKDKLRARLGIATKVGVSLSEFKPRVKPVKVVHVGHSRPTTHYGVTVKLGNRGRDLVPGGFLSKGRGSGKQLVLARKGKARRPTVALRTMLFTDVAKAKQSEAQRHMLNQFNKDVAGYIDFEIKKKLSQR